MQLVLFALLSVLAISAPAIPALAFGADGHEAICEIAYRELTPHARAKVDALISIDSDDAIKSFRDSCVWPDFRGSIQESRRPDHYINVPRNWVSIWREQCHQVDRCLFTAINDDIAVLRDPSANTQQKLVALKFLGHWIGDIHQPLHISYADDRGGNEILVKGVAGCASDGKTKLHAVWDSCIPGHVMQQLHASDAGASDIREGFGIRLRETIRVQTRQDALASLSPLAWANESFSITRLKKVGYCVRKGQECHYSATSKEYVRNASAENEGMRTLTPAGTYENDFADIVAVRMQKAGVRLGAVLNQIFAE